ncbi:ectoine/hydroxyectoine ABC transporter substrate-binding protein EhuB [Rhizobium sp. WYJ-E13]|uniref:ectoine/hydroxyectoine ABC transporter substrate-binding protein EhuB n=1 Tax=Rhizobium sp. WYJ-E13 TaxID=2849093 RepID=UPI001C1EAC4D|nr:ectoine/hydroxyectoine ABC transporter substrate-binding protein EhuB [Rhizobium sp. WYJ-E13]QWW72401.1 ectoine/hydroxyectoine ABC transporter substrate-binding protein EhuB [Rhizobium sp. WYJ-E13]
MFKQTMATIVVLASTAIGASAGLMDDAKAGKPVRVGFAEQEPFIVTGPNGQLTGYEVDLLKAVLAKMGIDAQLEAVPTQFGALIPGLQAKRFDIIASDLYIRPDRCKLVAFAEPTHFVNDGLIVPAGNPKAIHSFQDVAKDPSLKMGYLVGGGPIADHALAMGVKKEQLVALPDIASLLAAVKTDRIDAFLNTGVTIQSTVKTANDPAIERAMPFEQAVVDGKTAMGIGSYAFRLEDKDFVADFDKQLLAILTSDQATKIGEPYGFTREDIPAGKPTTKDLCK